MSSRWLLSLSLLVTSVTFSVHADAEQDDVEATSPLTTEVEFGYQSHSGNSDSQSLNARLEGEYTSGRHRSSGEWKFYQLYKDGEEDKRQSTYTLQSDYKLGAQTYLYGNIKGVDSRYSAYFKDYTLSSGLGYQVYNTDKLLLEIEVGPGYRYQEPNDDEIDDDDIIFPTTVKEGIFRGNINAKWQAMKTLSFTAEVTFVTGHSNSRTDTDFSLINNITEDIALKLAHSRQSHNKVPQGLSKKDSIFSINLLFLFN